MPTPLGSFVWYEYMAADAKAAANFYAAVVGWGAKDAGMAGFPYTLLSAGPTMVAGLMTPPEEARKMGARPGWLGYVGVPTSTPCDEARRRRRQDLSRRRRYSRRRPLRRRRRSRRRGLHPVQGRAGRRPAARRWRLTRRAMSAGASCAAATPRGAFAFYSGLFGWKKTQAMDMGPMGAYQVIATDGGQGGGMMTKPAETPAPFWLYYFNVDAIDAAAERVKSAGGSVVRGPNEVPGGGWVVRAIDPQGADFALLASRR